jgi:uncharacterized protein YprB with RNaseH-like and TPR domain
MNNNSTLSKTESKEEILSLYKQYQSSDKIAEVLQEKHEIYDISTASLARKIRSWMDEYRKEDNPEVKITEKSPAKVLVFDIETSPLVAYLWSKWQNNINDDDIIEDWNLLCFSAKWLFEDKIISFKLTPKELKTRDDSRLTREIWKLLNEADIVIAHNGKKFDIKRCNSKFAKYRLNLPASYITLDTLLYARSKFGMTSNKLDYLGEYLGVGNKMETPKGMWKKVMEGDYDMLTKMSEYCDQDVRVLEDVYLAMRPYIQPHPNMGLYVEDNVQSCTCCGSANLTNTGKSYATTVTTYDLLRCDDCGSLMRSRQSNMTLSQKKKILSSVPQ